MTADAQPDTTTPASLRYAILEVATLAPTVVLWSVVLGAGDLATMLVVWVLRVGLMAALWTRAIGPAIRWHRRGRELGDPELLAIDEAMSDAPQTFARSYALATLGQLVIGTSLALLGFPRPLAIGAAELIGALMMAIAVVVIVLGMQYWLWAPLESARTSLGSLLRERGLTSRRRASSIVRSQLLIGAASTLAMFVGCFGLGGMVHVRAQRDTSALDLQRRVELAARSDLAALPDGFAIVGDAELPPALDHGNEPRAVAVTLQGSEALAASWLGEGRWLLAREQVDEQLGWFVLLVVGIGVALAIPMTGTTLANARSLADQLLALGKLTRQVTEGGKIRGIPRVVSLRNDEVDVLVRDFNAMLDMFDELTSAAAKVAQGDLRVEFVRPGELHDVFRSMIERLHAMVVQIRTTALDLASAAAEIHSITQEQARAAEQQSGSVREVSETVASLASSAETITATAASVLANADQTLDTTKTMIARIDELSGQANGVGELLELIREIADRSDLLALNGSLEATRVGEAGRGFALVAAEMRRLAERVTSTVGDVRARVAEIKGAGASAVRVAEQSRALAEQTAAAARHISLVTDRQGRETDQVAQTVRDVAGVVIATAGATSQTREAAEGLRLQAEQLERLTRQFKLRRETDEPRAP